jgi:hypothetical protein
VLPVSHTLNGYIELSPPPSTLCLSSRLHLVLAKLALADYYQLAVTFGTTNSEVLAYFITESKGLMIKVSCSLLAITVAGRFIAESFLLHFEIEFMG